MYVIVEIAGQQFKAEKGRKLYVHRLQGEENSSVSFDKVLLTDNDGQVKVRTAVNTFHFLESKRHQEFDVCSCVGIMCQFVVVMETVMIITET